MSDTEEIAIGARAICRYINGRLEHEPCKCAGAEDRCIAVDVYGGESAAVLDAFFARARARRAAKAMVVADERRVEVERLERAILARQEAIAAEPWPVHMVMQPARLVMSAARAMVRHDGTRRETRTD